MEKDSFEIYFFSVVMFMYLLGLNMVLISDEHLVWRAKVGLL